MKKQYLFIWMMAATMFAASCSKDGSDEKVDTQTPAEVSQDVQTKKTHPITIVAEKKSSSVSKVSLANDNSTLVFDGGDVLVLMDNAGQQCGELNLKNGAGESSATFEGTIDDGVTSFTAQIGNELQSFATSDESLKALVDANTFLKSEVVQYTEGETISIFLTDQNAYFAIATNLDNTKIKIGNADEQTISANGIWIAVPDGTSVTLFGKTVTAAKGQFYSVAKDNLLTSISLSDATATIAVGGTKDLSVSAYAPNTASNAVAWSSSNTAVASVSETGVVTGVAVGTATITATATDGSGETATCTVKVIPAGYVDLGVESGDGTKVYFEQNPSSDKFSYDAISDKSTLPSPSEWELLVSKCCWKWVNDGTKIGYYVFKAKSSDHEGSKRDDDVLENYDESSDPCIFLPFVASEMTEMYCFYWSRETNDVGSVLCLNFDEYDVHSDYDVSPDIERLPVCTVWRSK